MPFPMKNLPGKLSEPAVVICRVEILYFCLNILENVLHVMFLSDYIFVVDTNLSLFILCY